MAHLQPLQALNKSSAQVASFGVRLSGGNVTEYTFISKRDQTEVTAYKFEVYLVGNKPHEYCVGFIKGSRDVCQRAATRFADESVWALSRVSLDTFTPAQYISMPILFRVDLTKSIMSVRYADTEANTELLASMPKHPVPPRSVADVIRITTYRCTDLIALVKEVGSNTRKSKAGDEIANVVLVDNSAVDTKKVAAIEVSVFGASKIQQLRDAVGSPMAFFSLSIVCENRDEKPKICHYVKEKLGAAPECAKTVELREKGPSLKDATNIQHLTKVWVPSVSRDVDGLQPLSCAALLDYTAENPEAMVPEVNQLMWVHIEEPQPEDAVMDNSGERIWFVTTLRDNSGPVSVGVPQHVALQLARVSDVTAFTEKHKTGKLNMPLLSHVRISRTERKKNGTDGASQPVDGGARSGAVFLNHTLEALEVVTWDSESAPNAAYSDVLTLLNKCPSNDEGITFAYLADLQPDPYCGMSICYDKAEGPKGIYAAVLVASPNNSKPHPIGENGYKVVTTQLKDIANPAHTGKGPVGDHTLVGYCSLESLSRFTLDPPRGKEFRVALVLISKVDDEGFHIHKLEHIEPAQVSDAIKCMRQLRRLNKRIRPQCTEKRSRRCSLDTTPLKRARKLSAAPSDESLAETSD